MEFKKYLASVSYDGSDYSGFTKSLGEITVQSEIERVLIPIFKEKLNVAPVIKCASRTDAGVHSFGQIILFFLPFNEIPSNKLLKMINMLLPLTIRFNSLIEVESNFSLYSSIESKEYIYLVSNSKKSPFLSRYIWFFDYRVIFEDLEKILSLYVGEHNFSFLAKEVKKYKSTICNIYEAKIFNLEDKNLLVFYFKGDRFLYNMVRRLVGCALTLSVHSNEVNRSFVESLKYFEDLNSSKYLRFTTYKAPPNGLYLLKVNLKE